MNCTENECVCSVKKENHLGYYRLHTIWKSDGFLLNVTSKDGAWRGEMTASDVKKLSSQLEIEPDLYLKNCREALTNHDGQPGMVYAVEDGSFTWKKVIDEDSGIKIKMGYVMVEPASFVDTIQNLVSAALNCNKKLGKELTLLNEEKERIAANRNELSDKLNRLTETKIKMEDDLYARFISLLNSKKEKIRELERALGKKCKKGLASERTEEDPYEVDTDFEENTMSEEQDENPLVNVSRGKNESKTICDVPRESEPSTSSQIPQTRDQILEYFYGDM